MLKRIDAGPVVEAQDQSERPVAASLFVAHHVTQPVHSGSFGIYRATYEKTYFAFALRSCSRRPADSDVNRAYLKYIKESAKLADWNHTGGALRSR